MQRRASSFCRSCSPRCASLLVLLVWLLCCCCLLACVAVVNGATIQCGFQAFCATNVDPFAYSEGGTLTSAARHSHHTTRHRTRPNKTRQATVAVCRSCCSLTASLSCPACLVLIRCAVLSCVVLCCAVLCCAVLYCGIPRLSFDTAGTTASTSSGGTVSGFSLSPAYTPCNPAYTGLTQPPAASFTEFDSVNNFKVFEQSDGTITCTGNGLDGSSPIFFVGTCLCTADCGVCSPSSSSTAAPSASSSFSSSAQFSSSSSSSSAPTRCPALAQPQLPVSSTLMPAPTDVVYGSPAFSVASNTAICGLGLAINTATMQACDVAQLQLAVYQTQQGTHVSQVAATANVAVYSTQAPNGQYLYIPFVGGSVQLNTSATYLFVAGFAAGSALQVYTNASQSAPTSGMFAYSPLSNPLPSNPVPANFNFHATVGASLVFAPLQAISCGCFTASTLQTASPLCASSSSSTGSCRLRGSSGHC